MTTFNDILGTTPSDPNARVKQRYKSLCIRVHPDKGGSKALMQLVCNAYENISKGKGDSAILLSLGMFEKETALRDQDLKKARKERDELFAANQQLKAKLSQQSPANSTADSERKIALLEAEVRLLKEDRRRSINQKGAAIAEKHKLASQLRKALSENEILETEVNEKSGVSLSMTWLRLKPHLLVAFSLFFVFGVAMLSARSIDWGNIPAIFNSKEKKIVPKARVVYANNTQEQIPDIKSVIEREIKVKDSGILQPFLELIEHSGVWSLASYQGTNQPYIAIRSDKGSYVVNDCSGAFTFYLNQTYKPLRVAANLIYSHQNQQFHVYKIPYGQGASPHSWLQSRKLQINDDYFTSEQFGFSRAALVQHCLLAAS